jgi:endonuclease-3
VSATIAPNRKRPAARHRVKRRRRKPDPIRAWVRRLARNRPGLPQFVLDGLAGTYGHPAWERRLDPTSELILTILTQNSADVNAEKAFEALRGAYPSELPEERHVPGPGWGGVGLPDGRPPDWEAVEAAPFAELVEVIRPGGLPNQKARGIHAALTAINGIGVKTASVVLLFSFGMPLMPVDRHVERVAQRVGLIPAKANAVEAHEHFLALLEPDQMHEAHVNLIRHGRLVCHARKPDHDGCALRDRCRFFDPKAP